MAALLLLGRHFILLLFFSLSAWLGWDGGFFYTVFDIIHWVSTAFLLVFVAFVFSAEEQENKLIFPKAKVKEHLFWVIGTEMFWLERQFYLTALFLPRCFPSFMPISGFL